MENGVQTGLGVGSKTFWTVPVLFFVLDKGKSIITWADRRKCKIEEGGRHEKGNFYFADFCRAPFISFK